MSVAEKKPAKKPAAKKKDSAKKELERRQAVAEARRAEVELRQAELQLELDELRALDIRHNYALKVNSDAQHGVFNLERSVGIGCVATAGEIRQYCRTYPEGPVTLNIFSPGGYVYEGVVLYDTLRSVSRQGHVVTTVARGIAASMASILFLAGDVRLIGPEAEVMFHGMSAGAGGDLARIEEELEYLKKLEKRLDRIVFERTKVTPDLLAKKTKKKDWWLDSQECLKLKVATGLA